MIHSSGKRGRYKRYLSMLIAFIMVCTVFLPAFAENAGGKTDGEASGKAVAAATYEFYADGSLHDSQTVKDGETLKEPSEPQKDGSTFKGWYTEKDGGSKFTDFSRQTVTEDKTVKLYAGWQENEEPEEAKQPDEKSDETKETDIEETETVESEDQSETEDQDGSDTDEETASEESDSSKKEDTDQEEETEDETSEEDSEEADETENVSEADQDETEDADKTDTVSTDKQDDETDKEDGKNSIDISESKLTQSDEQSEDEDKDDSQSDSEDKDAADDEENIQSYEQAARKALSRMGAAEAFDADNAISSAYFTISGVDAADIPQTYTVQTGNISAATVPNITEYDYVNATVSTEGGDIEIESVGMLPHEDKTYIFYTTEGSSTGLAAMVLGENEKITLHYEVSRGTYKIEYQVQGGEPGDATDVDDIYGTDHPTTVKEGDDYAFRVNIPRGYTATVLVNGVEQGKLGVEPTYGIKEDSANVIETKGEPSTLTLSGIYEIKNVKAAQTVKVVLTKRTAYSFKASLWIETEYARGRADFGRDLSNIQADQIEGAESHEIWRFTTNTGSGSDRRSWILDSLQINGTKLNLPYGNYRSDFQPVSAETILPSGTVVTVTLEDIVKETGSYDRRTYSLSVSNCYEDITITGGNLFSSTTWQEIIADRLTGVEFQINDRQVADGESWKEPDEEDWTTMEQSQPFGVGEPGKTEWISTGMFPWQGYEDWTYEKGKNYLLGEDMRFRLDTGYVNPKVSYGTAGGIGEGSNGDLSEYLSEVSGPDNEGWYKFSVSSQDGNSITLLRIEAELGEYNVAYDKGNIPSESVSETNPTLPDPDNGQYNIVDKNQIIVSSTIPTDSTDKYAFQYWTLDGYVDRDGNSIQIRPNQVLDLKTVLETMEQNGQTPGETLTLKAHWEEVADADQITYTVQFIKDDDETDPAWSESYQAPSGTTIILDLDSDEVNTFLDNNPGYVVDETRTELVYENIGSGAELKVYFIKNTTTVTLKKVVTGNMGDKDQQFDFDVSIDDADQGEIKLSNNQTKTFTATIGSTFKFKETDAQGYDTTVTYTDSKNTTPQSLTDTDGDDYYTVTVTDGMYITVTNEKQVNPPMGLSGGSDSWMILLGAAAILAVTSGGFYLRRRKTGAHD